MIPICFHMLDLVFFLSSRYRKRSLTGAFFLNDLFGLIMLPGKLRKDWRFPTWQNTRAVKLSALNEMRNKCSDHVSIDL